MPEFAFLVLIAAIAALASPLAGAISIVKSPSSLFLSTSLGFAAGVLVATITLEMLPQALELGPAGVGVGGFVAGIAAIYALDLFIHRGRIVGEEAEQVLEVERYYRRRRPRGDKVSVLAAGTTVEEMVEGLAIGVGVAIQPQIAVFIVAAIIADNLAEGLSIGVLIRSSDMDRRRQVRRIFMWTSVIGLSVFASAIVSNLLLRDLPEAVIAFFMAFGAAGMFYLTLSNLIPSGHKHHYQQSSVIASSVGFVLILVISRAV